MTHTINIPSIESLPQAAKEFAALMGDETVYAFRGEMGAGKTTFIRELCRALGVDFDLYRLESVDDALEIGVEDYFDSGALCLLEWPERIEPLLPDDTVTVNVNVNPDMSRTMTVDIPD